MKLDKARLRETEITGEEKSRYLAQLDRSIAALVAGLSIGVSREKKSRLEHFGDRKKWDWKRLSGEDENKRLADLVERVRKEYSWFDWIEDCKDHEKNRGYFEEIGISDISGLPWYANFINLGRIKSEAGGLLEKDRDYSDIANKLVELLTGDYDATEQVPTKAKELVKEAMKRNFLEMIKDSPIIDWKCGYTNARKIMSLGGEELWTIESIRYFPASSMFEIYLIDLWQDIRTPKITEEGKKAIIAPELEHSLSYGPDNAAWFVLQSLDDAFESIHPVHVSKALIGPFESKYIKHPIVDMLPISRELIREDPNTAILRFSRQYSYAPNHREDGDKIRQEITRDLWSDEFIISPTIYTGRINSSILGTEVRVLEA